MNEEIQFGLGLNTDGFSRGLRKAKGLVDDFKSSGMSLGTVLQGAFAGLTIAAITQSAKSCLDFAHTISTTAENLGVSTNFLQQFSYGARRLGADSESAQKGLEKLNEKIGEARSGEAAAIQEFQKWGIALQDANGHAKTTEEVAEAISKRIGEIEDPAQRTALAFELMGKGGAKLVETLRQLDAMKEKSKGKILDEHDIAVLDDLQKKSADRWEQLKAIGGKALSVGATVFGLADPNAYLKKKFSEIDEKAAANAAGGDVHPDVTKTKEYIKALQDLRQAQIEGGGGDKLVSLMEQRDEIQKNLDAMQGDSVAKVQMQTELQKKENEILQERQKIADDYNRKQADAQQKQKEADERKRAMVYEIGRAQEEVGKANDALSNAKSKRYQLSVDDLTSSRFRFGGQLGQDQQTALQIKELERQGEFNRVHGFLDEAKDRYERADKLRDTLSTDVVESDRHPFKGLEESAKEQAEHLKQLVDKATNEGINVNPSMGK